jgi:geranylgeranyl diphosphate synthase type II
MNGLGQFKAIVDAHLAQYLDSLKESIYTPATYMMKIGGKRIRPSLMLAGMEAYGGDSSTILDQAIAIEVFHNFTLLHDDVMDNADVRRGHQTVHVKWDENQAILTGDIMFAMANDLFLRSADGFKLAAFKLYNDTASEVCLGQQLDMEFETRDDVSVDEYLEMIRLKTSVLLGASMAIGAMYGGANEAEIQLTYEFAMKVGLAFQIQDDYLDTFGDTTAVGKRAGGDILRNKKTILLIKAMEMANSTQRSELQRWYSIREESQEKVDAVRGIMADLKVDEIIDAMKRDYMDEGLEAMHKSQMSDQWKGHMEEFTGLQLVRTY